MAPVIVLCHRSLQDLCRGGIKKGRPTWAGLEALIPDGSEVGSGGQGQREPRVIALALLLYREELAGFTARTRKV